MMGKARESDICHCPYTLGLEVITYEAMMPWPYSWPQGHWIYEPWVQNWCGITKHENNNNNNYYYYYYYILQYHVCKVLHVEITTRHKKTSSKMLSTKLVEDKGIYNIPLNIAHLIAPKKPRYYCTPFLHTKTLTIAQLYTFKIPISLIKTQNALLYRPTRKVGNNSVCAKSVGFCVCAMIKKQQ
jgi:hypothetical protein